MKAVLIIALLSSQIARASEPPTDAPIIEHPPPRLVMMTEDDLITVAKRIVACETTLKVAEDSFLISKPVLIGGIVGIVVVAVAVGAAVTYAADSASRK